MRVRSEACQGPGAFFSAPAPFPSFLSLQMSAIVSDAAPKAARPSGFCAGAEDFLLHRSQFDTRARSLPRYITFRQQARLPQGSRAVGSKEGFGSARTARGRFFSPLPASRPGRRGQVFPIVIALLINALFLNEIIAMRTHAVTFGKYRETIAEAGLAKVSIDKRGVKVRRKSP